jgi:hypothetical protein
MGSKRGDKQSSRQPIENDSAGAPPAGGRQRNEKTLQARIPEDLDREIKRRAGRLGMSVSTVVRNVLLNTFNLVEGIVSDGTAVAMSITGDAQDGATSATERGNDASLHTRIIGWQEAILELNAVCDHCNSILTRGTSAAIAIHDRAQPASRPIICKACLTEHLDKTAATEPSDCA